MMGDPVHYDLAMIKKMLPHRSPFLFVDRVIETDEATRMVAEKDLSPHEPYFQGHFPGRPLMPGVLVTEALAQTSGILASFLCDRPLMESGENIPTFFYLAHTNIKFITPAEPGQVLRMESVLKKEYGRLFLFDVSAVSGGSHTAEGTLTLAKEEGSRRSL